MAENEEHGDICSRINDDLDGTDPNDPGVASPASRDSASQETRSARPEKATIGDSDSEDDMPLFTRKKINDDLAGTDPNDPGVASPASRDSASQETRSARLEKATIGDSDSEDDMPLFTRKKKAVNRSILDDSDDDEEEPETKKADIDEVAEDSAPLFSSCPSQSQRTLSPMVDADDNSNDSEDVIITKKKKCVLPDDLFDAELDDDDDEDQPLNTNNKILSDDEEEPFKDEGYQGDDGEAAIDEPEIGKKKGASRKSSSRNPRLKKEDICQIHSETQRMVRESSVRLPYHKPKVELATFLARSHLKQQQLHNLKGPSWKRTPDLASLQKEERHRLRQKNRHSMDSVPLPKLSTNIAEDEPQGDEEKRVEKEDSLCLAEDELPDLIVEKSKESKTNLIDAGRSQHFAAESTSVDLMEENGDGGVDDNGGDNVALVVSSRQQEVAPACEDEKRPNEQDSGYLTNTMPSSEEEVSGDGKEAAVDSDKLTEKSSGTTAPGADVGCTPKNTSPTTVLTLRQRTLLTPKFAGLQVDALMPKLSGTPDSFVDLEGDGDDQTPVVAAKLPVGVEKLMQRVAQHSAKRHPRKARDVVISTVSKEEVAEGHEELKLEKFTYHVDEEEEEVDPEMNKPGAKLLKLKERLQEQMKMKREEARQRRQEMYDLDNEEGLDEAAQEEAEEEAELTDQTDTDEENQADLDEEEGFDEEEEEEEKEEAYGANEKERSDNPFVEDEAEQDDDEEDEDEDMETEESLHLQLDTPEDTEFPDDDDEEEEVVGKRKGFLQAALQKSKTIEMFDEDANTESPTMSQKSNSGIEISDRPFERLSGSSTKAAGNMMETAPVTQSALVKGDDNDVSMSDARPSGYYREETSASLFSGKDTRDGSFVSVDSSFEMMGSMIQAGQRSGRKKKRYRGDRDTPDLFTPSSKSSMATNGANKSLLSESTLQTEGSQSPLQASQAESTPKIGSQNFHFGLDSESQSRMLDDDGLWRVKSTGKKSTRRQLMLEGTTDSSSQSQTDELLGLCSGKFTAGLPSPTLAKSPKRLFLECTQGAEDELLGLCSGQFTELTNTSDSLPNSQISTQRRTGGATNGSSVFKLGSGTAGGSAVASTAVVPLSTQTSMDELLGLCSGKFTVPPSQRPTQTLADVDGTEDKMDDSDGEKDNQTRPAKKAKKTKTRRRVMIEDDDEDDEGTKDSFGLASDTEEGEREATGHVYSDDEASEKDGEEEEEEAEESDKENTKRMFKGFTVANKHGKIRQDFVDEEAELSGSEYDSDENYDIHEKDDVLELEAGDMDDVGSEDELRNQVGRVHLKKLIDDDKKELRLMQEMYLADGDLHSEGAGRMRKFRWSNVDDDDTQHDMFHSDEEDAEDEADHEKDWRIKRLEREKFLEEQQAKEAQSEDSNSQLIKLGKVVFKQKKVNAPEPVATSEKAVKEKEKAPNTSTHVFKTPLSSRGSFLSRSKDALAKIAEMTKPVASVKGPRNSRNFVFTTVSPPKEKGNQDKKTQSVKRSASTIEKPANKRPKLDRTTSLPQGSIFNLF